MQGLKTSELDKMHAVQGQSQAIGEFLEWLSSKDILLAYYRTFHGDYQELQPYQHTTTGLLAEYFQIDLAEVDREQKAIIESLRNGQ